MFYDAFVGTIAYQFGFLLLILYFSTFGLENLRNKLASAEPIYFDYITLIASILLISIIIYISGNHESLYKILFIPTIFFYTVRFGRRWGYAASGMAVFALVAMSVIAFVQKIDLDLELDIIYAGVFFLTSWLVGSIVDMERAISDRLSGQVNVDDLTGLYNQRFLRQELNRLTEEEPDAAFGLMMVNLDYFKYYNESHGRKAGDRLLVEVAEEIVRMVGNQGNVFRSGFDEFVVIVKQGDREKALALAETIRCRIKERFTVDDPGKHWGYNLAASLGLSFYPLDGSTGEELVTKAGQALYKAQVISGNKVETFFSVLDLLKAQITDSEKEAFNNLSAFLAIINARDQYTFGHSERVLVYASIIATLLELPPPAKKYLQYGAYLHDIGKIEIDRSILNKPGNLDNSEWEIMMKHPLWGADIARQIKALHPAVPPILYHHERYDGQGYPFKLKGKNIPPEGRIMALADSFDAMTVERTYSKGIPYEEAIAELERNRQLQFDPDMVDLFTGFLRQHHGVDQLFTFKMKEQYLF